MKRSDVPLDQTWDLSLIYKNSQDAWKDAEVQGGRHAERVGMIMEIDRTGKLAEVDGE